ncbi:MAG: hypothetical protein QNL42_03430 [Flavobacteriaceae bacterium]
MGDFNAPIHTVSLGNSLHQKEILLLSDHDLIFDALNSSFTPEFIVDLTVLMTELTSEDHSRILVALPEQYANLPDDWIVVPSLREAEDVIEMERIERDLGF